MADVNDNVEELEELLVGLDAEDAVSPYSEDDDAVTLSMAAPVGDQEWMVQLSASNRKMMSTDRLVAELGSGGLADSTLVWRGGMEDWVPIGQVEDITRARRSVPPPPPRSVPAAAPRPPARSVEAVSTPMGDEAVTDDALEAELLPLKPMAVEAEREKVALPPPSAPPAPRSYTGRPVAVDFSPLPAKPKASSRTLIGAGAAALGMVLVTLYSLSKGGVFEATAATSEAVSALAPVPASAEPASPSAAPMTPPVAAPVPAPTPAEVPAPAAEASAAPATAQATNETAAAAEDAPVPARSAKMRSKLRRRSAGSLASSSDPESSEATPSKPAPLRSKAEGSKAEGSKSLGSKTLGSKTKSSKTMSRAVAATSTDKSGEDGPEEEVAEAPPPTTGFNRQAAQAALKDAAAQAGNCRPAGGPTGSGRVQVRYDASGRVGAVSFLTPGFDNTMTGSCIQMVFRRAKVESFSGGPVTMAESFEIR